MAACSTARSVRLATAWSAGYNPSADRSGKTYCQWVMPSRSAREACSAARAVSFALGGGLRGDSDKSGTLVK
jgi:hypothetical protein